MRWFLPIQMLSRTRSTGRLSSPTVRRQQSLHKDWRVGPFPFSVFLCCFGFSGGLSSFDACFIIFADLIISSKLLPNSHSSTDVFESVSLRPEWLARIKLLLAIDFPRWTEARSLPASFRFSSNMIFWDPLTLSAIEIAFPKAPRHAAMRSCFSTIRLSRFIAVSCTAALISAFNLGTAMHVQFSGDGYFSNSFFISSAGNLFLKISA